MWTKSLALSLLASESLNGTNPTATISNGSRSLQDGSICSPSNSSISEYVLLDIQGFPNQVTDNSLSIIEESVVEAYSNVAPSSCRALDTFSIQPEAFDNDQ
eukprot:scaffold545_cov127-Cylindrotheca_fusiformis.AAC.1